MLDSVFFQGFPLQACIRTRLVSFAFRSRDRWSVDRRGARSRTRRYCSPEHHSNRFGIGVIDLADLSNHPSFQDTLPLSRTSDLRVQPLQMVIDVVCLGRLFLAEVHAFPKCLLHCHTRHRVRLRGGGRPTVWGVDVSSLALSMTRAVDCKNTYST